jgi:DNA polymerase-3 subunit epsilon/CBS domain-containing protein
MSRLLRSMPLSAVEAVSIDCETTGLDPRKARLIEVAAVHVCGGVTEARNAFSSLVACPVPIPPSSTRVHGLTAADLAGAPDFADLLPGLTAFIGERVIVGHTIAFDLAILAEESKRCGAPFSPPPALDVRLLAQIVEPRLSSYSLDALASWLDIGVTDRHRASGDAVATARVFAALLPKLRERNIRTVGEALVATRRLTADSLPVAYGGGDAAARQDVLEKLDGYPYRHRIAELMSHPPLSIGPEATVSDALAMMTERRISSLLVGTPGAPASETGIVTERDMLRVMSARQADAFALAIGPLASRPLQTVPQDDFIYRAIGRMSRLNIRHLAAIDESGAVAGMVSARDLLRLRAGTAIALGDEIAEAPDAGALGRAWARLPAMAESLVQEGVPARTIAAVVARELCALTDRATALAVAAMERAGKGPPPVPYAMLILGSAGRGESLLAMDQDNALVFAEGEVDGPADRWFAEMGSMANRILDETGVPLCKGGVMAREEAFRGSDGSWRRRITGWIGKTRPEDLLAVDIFFDFRPAGGDPGLARRLWHDAWDAARESKALLKLLARSAEGETHATGFFGRIRTDEDGRIDLKRAGLARIVPAARALALAHGVKAHATADRLAGLVAGGHGSAADLAALDSAHRVILDRILRQQIADIAAGRRPGNRVDPKLGGEAMRAELKAALDSLGNVDAMVRDALS